jgi:hypothetical protein
MRALYDGDDQDGGDTEGDREPDKDPDHRVCQVLGVDRGEELRIGFDPAVRDDIVRGADFLRECFGILHWSEFRSNTKSNYRTT